MKVRAMRTISRLRDHPSSRVGERLRLLTSLGLLIVAGMLVWRSADPHLWRGLTGEPPEGVHEPSTEGNGR